MHVRLQYPSFPRARLTEADVTAALEAFNEETVLNIW